LAAAVEEDETLTLGGRTSGPLSEGGKRRRGTAERGVAVAVAGEADEADEADDDAEAAAQTASAVDTESAGWVPRRLLRSIEWLGGKGGEVLPDEVDDDDELSFGAAREGAALPKRTELAAPPTSFCGAGVAEVTNGDVSGGGNVEKGRGDCFKIGVCLGGGLLLLLLLLLMLPLPL